MALKLATRLENRSTNLFFSTEKIKINKLKKRKEITGSVGSF